jgi:hypothetical protein
MVARCWGGNSVDSVDSGCLWLLSRGGCPWQPCGGYRRFGRVTVLILPVSCKHQSENAAGVQQGRSSQASVHLRRERESKAGSDSKQQSEHAAGVQQGRSSVHLRRERESKAGSDSKQQSENAAGVQQGRPSVHLRREREMVVTANNKVRMPQAYSKEDHRKHRFI